jgi:hypothetical protein
MALAVWRERILLSTVTWRLVMMAQQKIDTFEEQVIAIQQAVEEMQLDMLKRNSKCRGADATFAKLMAQPPNPQLQPVVDYLRHVYAVDKYMKEKKVTVETALTVMGDLVLPPALPLEIDPFNGCIVNLYDPPGKPAISKGSKAADDFIFYWQSIDWHEDEQANLKTLDKHLPPEKRVPFIRLRLEYVLALSRTLTERADKGEITLLQEIKAGNAAGQYLIEQGKQYGAQLRENLVRAKEQDNETILKAVAIGMGVVATAALVLNASANYRIANAQSAMANTMQLQALQAPAPIQCNYTLPGRYGSGYVYCR